LRRRIESLQVINVVTPAASPLDADTFEEEWSRIGTNPQDRVISRLPAVIRHPETHLPVLNVCQMFSLGFEGMEYAAGRSLLDELFEVLYAPVYVYEHRWANGDILIWDNIALQHKRSAVAAPSGESGVRTMTRVAIGDHYAELRAYLPKLGRSSS